MMTKNKKLSSLGLLLALMTVVTTTAVEITVSTKTSDDGETDGDGEIFFLVDGSYTSKQDHHKGSDDNEVDTKTYTTNSNPTKLKLCIDGYDSWTYVYITVNSVSIFTSSSGHRLDNNACREYNIPSSVFPVLTGYSRVVVTTGTGSREERSKPVHVYFLVSNSVVSSAKFFDNAAKGEQFDKTYQFYNNVKPDEVRFCLDGTTWDRWKLKTLVVNGQTIDANDMLDSSNQCREYLIPDPLSYSTQSPAKAPTTSRSTTRAPTTQPTKAPSTSQPTSQPTNVPTIVPSGSPTTPPTHAPTNTPTQVPTLSKCRCALTWGDDRSSSCSFNIGCPLQPCDNNPEGAWCRVRNSPCAGEQTTLSGKWAYCDPLETWPPTTVPTSSSPTTSPTTSTPSTSPTTSSPTTSSPTKHPSVSPTPSPTVTPTSYPTTSTPTTSTPTSFPTQGPTTSLPTAYPTILPTPLPSSQPSQQPTKQITTTAASGEETSTSSSSDSNNLIVLAVLVVFFCIAICFGCYLGYLRWQRNKEKDNGGRDGFQNPLYKQGSLFDSGNSIGYIEVLTPPGQFINPKYAPPPQPSTKPTYPETNVDNAYEEPVMLKKTAPVPNNVVATPSTTTKQSVVKTREPPSDDYYDNATSAATSPPTTKSTTTTTTTTAIANNPVAVDDELDDGVYNNMSSNGQQADEPTAEVDDENFDGFYGPVGDQPNDSNNSKSITNDEYPEFEFGC